PGQRRNHGAGPGQQLRSALLGEQPPGERAARVADLRRR
ncbi:DeoR family transcriptional regulator, partial [Streptomyces sp. NPDC005918]